MKRILQELVSYAMYLDLHAKEDKIPLKYSKWESDIIKFVLNTVFYQNVGYELEVGKNKAWGLFSGLLQWSRDEMTEKGMLWG